MAGEKRKRNANNKAIKTTFVKLDYDKGIT
jgi:hypothetical protein